VNLQESLDAVGLLRVSQSIASLSELSIRFDTTQVNEDGLGTGASKVGGRPDLPPGITWPAWKELPLSFLAQINLAELSKFEVSEPLPSSGVLFFFYDSEQRTWGFDPNDTGSWRVIFSAGSGSNLVRCSLPDALPEYARFPACSVSFYQENTVPPFDSMVVNSLGLSEQEQDAYLHFLDAYEKEHGGVAHRILGHPDPIQGDMQLECQLVSHGLYAGDASAYQHPRRKELEPGSLEWKVLLQLDSDDNAAMMWGDVGRLYFWIRESALEAHNFDEAWMILQCC
jgi:uncharacterized protein YwqG